MKCVTEKAKMKVDKSMCDALYGKVSREEMREEIMVEYDEYIDKDELRPSELGGCKVSLDAS